MRTSSTVLALVFAATLAGCEGGVLDPKGPIAFQERQLLFDATGIMLAIVIPVVLATLWVAFWFRASNERATYLPTFRYSGRIELLIWSIPLMTVLLVGSVAWISAYELDPPRLIGRARTPLKIQAVSLDWKWLFIYPDEGVASVNELMIPVGAPVSFELTSSGVMNSFFVPQLAGQIYTMAGMVTRLNMQADFAGTYRGISANFSGDGFADMHFNVKAVDKDTYSQWVDVARGSGSKLDTRAYAELITPSKAVVPFTYRSIAPGLFTSILSAASESVGGLCVTTMRAER